MDVCLSTDHELAKIQNMSSGERGQGIHPSGSSQRTVLTTLPIGMMAIPEMGGLCVHVCEIEYCMSQHT